MTSNSPLSRQNTAGRTKRGEQRGFATIAQQADVMSPVKDKAQQADLIRPQCNCQTLNLSNWDYLSAVVPDRRL